jgi:hypothetical protein
LLRIFGVWFFIKILIIRESIKQYTEK